MDSHEKHAKRGMDLMRRLLQIKSKLNNGTESQSRLLKSGFVFSLENQCSKSSLKHQRELENNELEVYEETSSKTCVKVHKIDSKSDENEAVETDESDAESEVGFTNDKICAEQKIRQFEKMEEQRTALIEAKRIWLIKRINLCNKITKDLSKVNI